LVRAAEPSRVVSPLAQLLVADAVVLVYLHRHTATRARIAVAGNDNRFALHPTFRLVMLLSRRFAGCGPIEPLRRPVVLEQFLFIGDVAHAAIRHAPLSISATQIDIRPRTTAVGGAAAVLKKHKEILNVAFEGDRSLRSNRLGRLSATYIVATAL